MAIRVKLPDGKFASFPDDMPHQEIEKVLQSHFPAPAQEENQYLAPPKEKGLAGIASDIGAIPGKIADYAAAIHEKAPESWEQIFTQPGRALKNVAAGAGETAKGFFNLPLDVASYLGKQDIPYFKQIAGPLAEKLRIGDTGAEKALGLGEEQPGDELLRDMFMFAGAPKVGSIAGKLPGVAKTGERISALRKHGPLKKRVNELESQHEEAASQHRGADEEFKQLKDFLEQQPGIQSAKPSTLKRKVAEAEQTLQGLQEKSSLTPEELRVRQEPEAPQNTPLSLVQPERAEQIDISKLPKTEVSQEPVKKAESLLKSHQQQAAAHEAEIAKELGVGNAHRKRVAEKLNPILEERQADVGKGYDKYIEGLKGKDVDLSNPREAKEITQDIHNLLKKGDTTSKEMVKLSDELASLGKGETMPADKFVSAYRSLRSMGQKTRSSAYGKSPQESDRLIEAADSIDADVAKMKKIIDKGLGEDNLDELNKLNHRYATEVAPLFKNKFFQYMQANNKAPTNMIEQLTNEPYIKSTNPNKITGTQILNEIIKGDPELLKNVVGERFAHKPETLHEWDEAAHNFTQHIPEVQEFKKMHHAARQNAAEAKMQVDQAKHEHLLQKEEASAQDTQRLEAAKQQNSQAKEAASEKTRLKKAEVQKQNEKNKAEHKQKAEYHKMQQQIKDYEESIPKLKEHIKDIQAKSKSRNLTLKQKLDIEHELKSNKTKLSKTQKDMDSLKRNAKRLGYAIGAVVVGTPVANKFISTVTGSN